MKSSRIPYALVVATCAISAVQVNAFCSPRSKASTRASTALWMSTLTEQDSQIGCVSLRESSRRKFFQFSTAGLIGGLVLPSLSQQAIAATGPGDGNLPDLPTDAVRSYLQYRVALQIAADYYLWELKGMVANTEEWGEVGQIFRANNNKGQGQPSRLERDFVNPMRILGLSMPPDLADRIRDSQFKFEKAMSMITKATAGIRRDLPVEIDKSSIASANAGWEDGRVALNEVFDTLNEATGLSELKSIPPSGPNQTSEYGRSPRRYFELMKKTKLCQNRGGPALSQAWGQLMVSGYLQDSCGIPDLEAYFYQ